jgi:adenine/guanine phosphoribosyltransferase-like PRPP-binding protein
MKTKFSLFVLFFATLSIAAYAAAPAVPQTFKVAFGNFSQEYNVVAPKGNPNVNIVYIPDFSDNYAMGKEAAASLAQKMPKDVLKKVEVVLVPGDKANMLGTLVYENIAQKRTDAKYGQTSFVILRSAEKGKVENSIQYDSITGGNKTLNIREDQGARIKGKKVLLVDDVLSSGGTLKAAKELSEKYGCEVVAVACVATEGDKRDSFEGKPLFSLTHLPVWVNPIQ